MLLKNKNGIKCDLCSTTYSDKFVYYSCSGDGKYIDFTVVPPMSSSRNISLNIDMCENCYSNYKTQILNNVSNAKSGFIKDDLSGVYYNKCDLIKLDLTKVDVNKDRDKPIETITDIDIIVAGESFKNLLQSILNAKQKTTDEWTSK